MKMYFKDLISLSLLSSIIFLSAQGCNKNNLTTPPPVSVPIRGTVVDSTTNIPVPFVIVQLGSQAVTTSSMGSYSFSYSQAQSGAYTMKAIANGYQTGSKQIRVISDTTQTVDFYIQALQETTSLNNVVEANSYSLQKFNFDNYSFVQCSNGIMSHDVKVTIQIDTATYPLHVIVVSPDGSYKCDQSVTAIGFNDAFMSNLCGSWAVIVYNSATAQATYSGKLNMDFSNYPISSDSVSTNVMVPINFPSIASDSSASFTRFLEAEMSYHLQLNISGGSNNRIDLIISDPGSNILLNQLISDNYTSPTFVATKEGFYKFIFSNKSPIASTRSVSIVASVTSSASVSGALVVSH